VEQAVGVVNAMKPVPAGGGLRRVAADSMVGSVWTMASRVTGLLRVVVVAAVLGPTQFGDLYQATSQLPHLAFELLAGALFASLTVPALVRHFDRGDAAAAARLASGFLTLSVLSALGLVVLAVAAGPLVLGVLTAGVPDSAERAGTGAAWLLLGLLLLQVPLYLAVGMATAVQNARGRFALAAGAPSVENLAIVAVMASYAVAFGTGTTGGQGVPEVALLGGGSTVAVLLHAAVQWWGARRCGAALVPVSGAWRDREVWALLRLAVPSMGYASLSVARYFCLLVVAGAVSGGVVALTIAYAFYQLPVALTARPVAQAALPALSRAHQRADDLDYGETFSRALGLALFLAVPAAVGYVLLSGPLATAVAFGEMASPEGRELLRYCLLGISLGVVGEAALSFGTQAAYARRDGRRPLRAVALRTVLAVAGMLGSLALVEGAALLFAIGFSVAVSDLITGALLCWMILRPLPRPSTSLVRMVIRTGSASLAMIPVVLPLVVIAGPQRGQAGSVVLVLVAGAVGAATYLAVQWALHSPEIAGLLSLVGRGRTPSGAGRG
jgi:putative peptidoglycan lipid II flippase